MSDFVPRPDLVIAIDFGMTCTGVAYCNVSTGSDNVRWIQRWPGRMQANENKVPTILVYPDNSDTPSSWGFLAETPQEQNGVGKESKEWFKIMLDEERLQQMQRNTSDPSKVPKIYEVEKWYCDYFKLLYQYIENRLRGELASQWEDANIEFIFSVPTTWKPNPTVERFRSIISRAGFGKSPSHTAVIGLTEAEAAAVHTARESPAIFKEREILLVCDVGGGTTDLSALRVTNTGSINSLALEQLDVVFGATIGSTQLDRLFEKATYERLRMVDLMAPMRLEDLETTAWEMRLSKEYQNAKCDYGSPDDTDMFSVAIPRLSRSYVNDHFGIRDGEMRVRRNELQGYFDSQIAKLFEMIDKQLTRLQQRLPNEQVAHLVLSGGLGNSLYLQQRLRARYSSGNAPFANAQSLQVRVAPDPQLVVCKGISILEWRCSRASYGTMCKVLYNPQNPQHFGQRTERDTLDGKLYITDAIDWLIKKGEPVSINYPIVRNFRRKCSPATAYHPNPSRVFPTAVVSCDLDKELLPLVMNTTCQKICEVQSDFSSLPLSIFKLKNRHWWNTGEKYHRVDYCVKVALGPADIRFELWRNGQKLSKDNLIKVEWLAAPAPPEVNRDGNGNGNGNGNGAVAGQQWQNQLPAAQDASVVNWGGEREWV
ncbi:hypothetical protein K432DRAFT_434183 [Lepidopterella palustris CBS 459.81]|uniref:Actin-like ATPase domain-containing protein n=1 Tax=Lepidopterella palustris CBS 459.81 TaxID=1314670 RepID=A0A8E2ECR8_9PEZI|nr:hypothetical protein K432DRAFT_434183 [Lepidopterella palustris CBS 459.81]